VRNKHLDKPHLCALYGCVTLVDGGVFACPACERDLTGEERRALASGWMGDNFDALVECIQRRVRDARTNTTAEAS
jgi:hypothetical protein